MESSELAGNAVTFLHDEDYAERLIEPRLDHRTWVNPGGRPMQSLDGDWAFTIDLFDTGLRQRWFEIGRPDGPRKDPLDYDPYDSETAPVPSVWNLLDPEWLHFEGGAWYSRDLEIEPGAEDERFVLRVGGANYITRIFVNGRFAGSHVGGSTPFCCDLTELVRPGINRLMIHVENRRQADRVPSHHIDWFNYGGIHRSVGLMRLPLRHIRDAHIRFVDGEGIVIDVLTSGKGGDVRVQIPELGLDISAPVLATETRLTIPADPERWSPDNPKLYDVTLDWHEDRFAERVGFRTVQVRGRDVLINGEPAFLRGICVHEDDLEAGRVATQDTIARIFADAKALGANFIRLAHYPHHEMVAREADRLGLLLWAEVPVYWSIDFANPATRADADNQLAELIARDRNRASVICWGLANETPDTDERFDFLTTLAGTARRLDPNRPLAAACLFDQADLKIRDRLADLVEIVGVNEYFGWYDSDADDLARLLAAYDRNQPLIISETGCDVQAGRHGAAEDLYTEEFGVTYFRRQIDAVRSGGAVSGFCPWLLYDFRTERRKTRTHQGWNLKGLIAADKVTRKRTFDVVRAFYQQLKDNHGRP
ncbi:MAG: hypothetical protein JJ920_08515 [Roseitalea sp.]|jgi:beta-glucuronidase|nr:hypothetical protein [Roseitalea sp.]MBO6720987.1 hypothetical protein [Roseitalea sp.]MBO6742941.1 hypothetical protein [Roseitalea sp.]